MSVTLGFPSRGRGGAWRLNPGWLQVETVATQVGPGLDQCWKDNVGTAASSMVWGAFKACVRGHYISAIKSAKK